MLLGSAAWFSHDPASEASAISTKNAAAALVGLAPRSLAGLAAVVACFALLAIGLGVAVLHPGRRAPR